MKKSSNSCITECEGKKCRTIEGIFDLDNLQPGYNDILLLPAKAINIEVGEVVPTNNHLAIHNLNGEYFLNGNGDIQTSGEMTAGGSAFA